jgi:hypothetical protein
LGADAYANNRMIVIISRRSTTFAKRLSKYHDRGFAVIFPGLLQATHFWTTSAEQRRAIDQIKQIADQYQLTFKAYDGSWDYDGRGGFPERLSIGQAFETESKITFLDFALNTKSGPYWDTRKISQSYKQSPEYAEIQSDYGPGANLFIKENNLAAIMNDRDVGVMVKVSYMGSFETAWRCLIEEPCIPVEQIDGDHDPISLLSQANGDLDHAIRKFGKFRSEACEIYEHSSLLSNEKRLDKAKPWVEKVLEYRRMKIGQMIPKLIGLQWITQNPGRQWTSSVNPAVVQAYKFYGKFWTPAYSIISPQVRSVLLRGRADRDCLLHLLPYDVFRMIIELIPFIETRRKGKATIEA